MPNDLMKEVLGLIDVTNTLIEAEPAGALDESTQRTAKALIDEVKKKFPEDKVFAAMSVGSETTFESLLPTLIVIKRGLEEHSGVGAENFLDE